MKINKAFLRKLKLKKILSILFDVLLIFIFMFFAILILAKCLYLYDPLRYSGATITNIFNAGLNVLKKAEVYKSIYCTLYLTFKGFFIGFILSAIMGMFIAMKPKMVPRIFHIFNAIRAIPLTLLIPFLIALPILFPYPPGIREHITSKDPSYLIALGTFLYILTGIAEGIANRDKDREKIAKKIFKISKFNYLRSVLFYESLPQILTAIRFAILFAFVLSIVLEQLLQYPGIGKLISIKIAESTYENHNEAEALFFLFIVAFIGIFLDLVYTIIRNKLLMWEKT